MRCYLHLWWYLYICLFVFLHFLLWITIVCLTPDRYLNPLIRWVHLTVKDLSLGVLVNKSQQTKLGKINVLVKKNPLVCSTWCWAVVSLPQGRLEPKLRQDGTVLKPGNSESKSLNPIIIVLFSPMLPITSVPSSLSTVGLVARSTTYHGKPSISTN